MPALELLVKPLMDRPGKATALSTPGCLRTMSLMRRITSSVRSSVAPSGSWAKPTRYCLSCAGTKPDGTALNRPKVTPIRMKYTPMASALREMTRPHAAAVGVGAALEHPVEAAEEPAEQDIHDAGQAVLRRVVRLEQERGERRR